MLRVETDLGAAIHDKLDADMRQRLDTLVDEKVHDRQSRLSWLREPQPRVASASLAEILDKVALIRRTGISCVPVDPLHEPRMTQFAREGVRYTAQARSEEHTSELQSLMRISYAVFCLKKKTSTNQIVRLSTIHHHN